LAESRGNGYVVSDTLLKIERISVMVLVEFQAIYDYTAVSYSS